MAGTGSIARKLLVRVGVFALLLRCPLGARPDDIPLQFTHLTAEDGLSHSWVMTILQDRDGYIWLGTHAGLNRYDGYGFRTYRWQRGNRDSLLGSEINEIIQDRAGRIWVAHSAGFSLYRPKTDDFLNYSSPVESRAGARILEGLGRVVNSIAEDRSGQLWLGSDAGLFRFDPEQERLVRYRHETDNPKTLSSNAVTHVLLGPTGELWLALSQGLNRVDPTSGRVTRITVPQVRDVEATHLAFDRHHRLWVGTMSGVYRLNLADPENPKVVHFRHHPDDPRSLASDVARVVFSDRNGDIWIGTENAGLDKFDYRTGSFLHCRSSRDNPHSLSNDSVYSMYQDRTGLYWIGTFAGGVNRSRRNGEAILHFRSLPGNINSPSYNSITSFYEDKTGYIWIGTDGGGLDRFDPRTRTFRHWNTENSYLTARAILDVCEDSKGSLLIGTWGGGINILNLRTDAVRTLTTRNSTLPSDSIFDIEIDKQGRLLLGTYQHCLVVYDPVRKTSHSYVPMGAGQGVANALLIQKDSEGDYFVGTESGLMIFDPDDDSIVTYSHSEGVPTSIAGDKVYSIVELEDGEYLIGTDQGLDRFDKKTGVFRHLQEAFPGVEIRSLAADKRAGVWVGTSRGLARYEPRTGQVKHYTRGDGTLGHDYNRCAYLTARDGTVYLGGLNNGFNMIHPDRITDNTLPPPVVLTDFKIANHEVVPGPNSVLRQPIGITKEIHLPYYQSSFSFGFAALDFSNPERNGYAFRLHCFEKEWNYVGSQRLAAYTNISPGRYVFETRASNGDGYWNVEGARVVVEIHPPFWATVWFRILVVACLAGIVLVIIETTKERHRVLRSMNLQLNQEIQNARKAEEALREARDQLEEKVRERTVQLSQRADQLRILAGELTLTEQRERRRLASLLHDHLQQLLVGAKFRVAILARAGDPVVSKAAAEIEHLLGESIATSRSLTAELSPPVLHEHGLAAGLEWLAAWMVEKHGLSVELQVENDLCQPAEDVSVLLFESVREALFNVVKHSGVRSAVVSARRSDTRQLEITITDQGPGFDAANPPASEQGGFGLFSIRERLSLIGGLMRIESSPGHGCRLTLIAPVCCESNEPPRIAPVKTSSFSTRPS